MSETPPSRALITEAAAELLRRLQALSRGRAFADAENQLLANHPPVSGADYAGGARPPQTGTQIVAEAVDACPVPGGRAAPVQA